MTYPYVCFRDSSVVNSTSTMVYTFRVDVPNYGRHRISTNIITRESEHQIENLSVHNCFDLGLPVLC